MNIKMWMVRAGRAAYLVDEFIEKNCVAIGWDVSGGDLTEVDTKEKIAELYRSSHSEQSQGKQIMSIGQIYRFRSEIKVGDYIITYNPEKRIYHIGEIKSDYKYKPDLIKDYNHIREVSWIGKVERDLLSVPTKNTIGAMMTLFLLNDNATKEFLELSKGKKIKEPEKQEETEIEVLRNDVIEQGYEFIKDKILKLDWEEMQELVAGILRAMGYKTRVSAKGADRGVDVIASPDGLGLEQPRIKVEVKHREKNIGSNQLRSFIGGLTSSDKGLYVSTGGFSKDARYEAERSNIPITLLDIDALTELLIDNYDKVDNDTMTLIPLKKLYWPA